MTIILSFPQLYQVLRDKEPEDAATSSDQSLQQEDDMHSDQDNDEMKKAKRSLNSFMAFRTYYGPALSPRSQKSISKLISQMWDEDLLHGKWTTLAKTYTILRPDEGEVELTLPKFLDAAGALLSVIPRDAYMGVMGWAIDLNHNSIEHSEMKHSFEPNANAIIAAYGHTNMGVKELTMHFVTHGGFSAERVKEILKKLADAEQASKLPMGTMALKSRISGATIDAIMAGARSKFQNIEEGDMDPEQLFDPAKDVLDGVAFNPLHFFDGTIWYPQLV